VPCESQHLNAVQLTLEQVDLIKRLIEKYSQHMQFAASSRGKYSVVMRDVECAKIMCRDQQIDRLYSTIYF